jgi:hypothetical protein
MVAKRGPASDFRHFGAANSVAFDDGPVQSGMPAMLELTGSAGGAPAEDIAVYTPDTASSLHQVSGFSQ